ncbi:MAG TPA: hypothetical protein VGS22_16675 [Thermoanaerobaculia bacterium]|nr:hypothetical protein [Thermoanaerobaculia bacterium]
MERLRRFVPSLIGIALYALLATLFLRPIWRVFADHIAPGPGDPILNLYFLKWGMHQIGLGLPNVWDANFFFPMKGTLTLSDHLLGPALQLFLLHPLVPSAIVGYNLLLWSSFVLTGASTAWVLRQAGCSRPAAFLGGALFAFCPYRWSQIWHLQVLLMQWLPLTLWSFDRLLAERTPRRAAWFLLFYFLHVTGGAYLAYMIHVPLAALLLVRLARGSERRELLAPRSLRILGTTALAALLLMGAIFAPYVRFSRSHKLERNAGDIATFGAAFSSYLSPAMGATYFDGGIKYAVRRRAPGLEGALTRSENSLFPGFLALGFGLAALFAVRGRPTGATPWWRARFAMAWVAGGFLLIAIASLGVGDLLTLRGPGRGPLPAEGVWWGVGLAAAAGLLGAIRLRHRAGAPPLLDRAGFPSETADWWLGLALGGGLSLLLSLPAFYIPAMRLLPGLSGMRVSARFGLFVAFTIAAFAARGVDAAAGRIAKWAGSPRGRRIALGAFGATVAVIACFELGPHEVRWMRVLNESEFPPVYGWLANRPEVLAVAEIPMFASPSETSYMYYSTAHWKPLANGFSGYEPPLHQELAAKLRSVPSSGDLERLRRLGITHLVVHTGNRKAHLTEADLALWAERMHGEVLRVFAGGRDFVYEIRPPRDRNPNLVGW